MNLFSDLDAISAIFVPLTAPDEGTLQINPETRRAMWKTEHTP